MAEKITGNDELKRQREEYEKIISKLNSEKKAYEQVYKKLENIEKNIKLIENIPKSIFIKAEAELAIQDKKSAKKSNQGKEDKTPMSYIIQEVTMKFAETIPQMGAVQATSMNLEIYLATICSLLQMNNANNVAWNSLNNVMLSSIHSALLVNNSELVSLRDELSKCNENSGKMLVENKTRSEEAEQKSTVDVLGNFLDVFATTSRYFVTLDKSKNPFLIKVAVVATVADAGFKTGKIVTETSLFKKIFKTTAVQYNPELGDNFRNKLVPLGEIKNPNTAITVSSPSGFELYNSNVEKGTTNNQSAKSLEKLKKLEEGIAKSNMDNRLNETTVNMQPNAAFNPSTNTPDPSQGTGIEEKLALMQASSTENMNALALLWDTYLQKVSQVYDMILLTISMKHMLMTMNTLLTILNLYLTWMTLPPMLEGVWQQILSGADIFLSNLKSKFTAAISEIKQKMLELSSVSINPPSSGGGAPGHKYTGTGFWKGGLTYVGERGRELIQYPTGERFMAEAKMLMNLPKGTKIFRNSMTERIMNNGFSGNNMMTADENNQLKKLGGFNGLSDYTDSKFGGGINYSNVKADNITVNITNTYGNQSPAQIKDTNNDLVRKINEVLFQKEDRKRRVSIG